MQTGSWQFYVWACGAVCCLQRGTKDIKTAIYRYTLHVARYTLLYICTVVGAVFSKQRGTWDVDERLPWQGQYTGNDMAASAWLVHTYVLYCTVLSLSLWMNKGIVCDWLMDAVRVCHMCVGGVAGADDWIGYEPSSLVSSEVICRYSWLGQGSQCLAAWNQ